MFLSSKNTIFFVLMSFLIACSPNKDEQKQTKPINKEALKRQFEKANRGVVQKESDDMDYYAKSHQMPFRKTNSGVRFYVYQPSAKGDSIKEGDQVTMEYTVSLLDGTECYSSAKDGPKTFIVGHEDLESGIHKGLQYLKKGDKALILIPSHLAHGLLGDMNKIPPQMPIVYDVRLKEDK
jgi:FKBP-type peptidyl-prolyl cis-trans isomerase